ncbi:tryptophan synthase subunit beta [Candidatus Gracilibacteria bacterium]|nr:tryptophan synthase subunit beta [Candidatus Gracilibacteria bacterium]
MSSLKSFILNPTGHFDTFGGRYVPELLIPFCDDLHRAFFDCIRDKKFLRELEHLRETFSGRPTPLTFCENLTKHLGGSQIFVKNEGLNHTGAHKINHCIGQVLVARKMGKKRIIAETGAGQHGLATATVCAKFGLECVIYMGRKDYDRQRPNVFWMERLGATVVPVEEGDKSLRDAINVALRDLISDPVDTYYLLGTVCGPHPYPVMNTYFQSVIGREVRSQMEAQAKTLPDCIIASCGGGSNAMGIFHDFLDDKNVSLVAVEAGGKGITEKKNQCDHASRFETGSVGVAEGFKSFFLQNPDGQIKNSHSISAGLDYSGVGPQIAYLKSIGRIETTFALDTEVLEAYELLAQKEGILAALESAHAVAEAIKRAKKMKKHQSLVIHCSGRGEKDLFITAGKLDSENFKKFLKEQSKHE